MTTLIESSKSDTNPIELLEYDGGNNWMNIHINTKNSGIKNALGYQYVLNRNVKDGKTEVSRATGDKSYEKTGEGDVTVVGNNMIVKVPPSALFFSEKNHEIEFKICRLCRRGGCTRF